MTRPGTQSCALVTVTDRAYAEGTAIMISSVLQANPWFRGDILLIHDQGADIAGRFAGFPNVRAQPVGDELRQRLAALAARHEPMRPRLPRFFSLEAFGIRGYDAVMYLDSDMLCTGSLEPLLAIEGGLVCCPDQTVRAGRARDPVTFLPRDRPAPGSAETVLANGFNSGLMLIRPAHLEAEVHDRLVAAIDPRTWDTVQSGHTDQLVLNRYFGNRWTAAPDRFNWLIPPRARDPNEPTAVPDDAILLHFLGRPKPWDRPRDNTDTTPMRAHGYRVWDRARRRYALARLTRFDLGPTVRLGRHWLRRLGTPVRRPSSAPGA